MIVLNEKKYAEECLNNDRVYVKPYKTLIILAKYYYHCLGYRKKRISTHLVKFMEEHCPSYRSKRESWNETIERISNNAKKYPIYQNSSVGITQSELDHIIELKNEILERIAFTILCIAKLNYIRNSSSNGWVNTPEKEIFEMAGVQCSGGDRSDYIGDLHIAEIVEFAKKNTNLSLRIPFIDSNGKSTLDISDFRALGNEYMKFRGDNYIRCSSCGLLIKGNKNGTRKYCNDCKAHSLHGYKIVHCIDCGEKIIVSSKNNKTVRCKSCQIGNRKIYKREWARRNGLV